MGLQRWWNFGFSPSNALIEGRFNKSFGGPAQ
jgi:hypothetical protein